MIRRVFLALFLLAAGQAAAHEQKEAVTRVLFNPRSGNIEVMHRFLLHDAEHVVKRLRGADADILGSADDRTYFADYVHASFSLADAAGRTLPLKPVGSDIEGRFLWVYSETAIPPAIESLIVRQEALLDIWPDQVNLVNVERNGTVRSAVCTRENPEAALALEVTGSES
jgi:hypothetical protein